MPTSVHVVPMADAVEHFVPGGLDGHDEPDGWLTIASTGDDVTCCCGPDVEHITNPYGPGVWLVTHHSLDGRERFE